MASNSDTVPETSSYSLTDRALWDILPPKAKLISPHPAAGIETATQSLPPRPDMERPWNRRLAICSPETAIAVARRVAVLSRDILDQLGYDQDIENVGVADFASPPTEHQPISTSKPRSLSEFNRSNGAYEFPEDEESAIDWLDLSPYGAELQFVEFSDRQIALVVMGETAQSQRRTEALKKVGFTDMSEGGAIVWLRPGQRCDLREMEIIFPEAIRVKARHADTIEYSRVPAPFKTALEERFSPDGELTSSHPIALPKVKSSSWRTALFLTWVAATLHAGDRKQESVKRVSVRNFLMALAEAATHAAQASPVSMDVPVGTLEWKTLEVYSRAQKKLSDVQAEFKNGGEVTPLGSLAMKWLAASIYEAKCEAQGLPPELHREPDGFFDDFLPIARMVAMTERNREIEKETCEAIKGLHQSLMSGCSNGWSFTFFTEISQAMDLPSAAEKAAEAIGEKDKNSYMAGEETANIRLAWDCLNIWLELHPGGWPSCNPGQPFLNFILLVAECAKAHPLANDPASDLSNFNVMESASKTPAQKAMVAFLEQESANGRPPVAVCDPNSADDGRFMHYVDRPSLRWLGGVGPVMWRERFERTRSTKRK